MRENFRLKICSITSKIKIKASKYSSMKQQNSTAKKINPKNYKRENKAQLNDARLTEHYQHYIGQQ